MNYANGSNAAFGIRRTSLLPVFHFRPSLRGGLKHVAVSSDSPVKTHRALVFPVTWQSPLLDWLLREFRLLVYESIRIALKEDIRSRARLVRAAYKGVSDTHVVYKQYIPSAFEVALSVLKAHRRRLKRGKRSSTPISASSCSKRRISRIGSTRRPDAFEFRFARWKPYSVICLFLNGINHSSAILLGASDPTATAPNLETTRAVR